MYLEFGQVLDHLLAAADVAVAWLVGTDPQAVVVNAFVDQSAVRLILNLKVINEIDTGDLALLRVASSSIKQPLLQISNVQALLHEPQPTPLLP